MTRAHESQQGKKASRAPASAGAPFGGTGAAPLARVLSLQRSAGNAAVSRLLAREPDPAEELDPETAALLDRLFGVRPEVASFEAVIGAETEQSSTGELTEEAMRLWRREHLEFGEAFRQAADRPRRGDPVQSRGPEGAEPGAYAQRWGLVLAVTRGGLREEVSPLLERGSPFQRALQGSFTRPAQSVRNPSADEMSQRIAGAINDLWLALGQTGSGELVVTFEGHGDDGGIFGADGTRLSRSSLAELGGMAADFGIHLVFIIDACDVGALVSASQEERFSQVIRGSAGQASEPGSPRWALAGPGRILIRAGQSFRVQLRSLVFDRALAGAQGMRGPLQDIRSAADELSDLQTHGEIVERIRAQLVVVNTYLDILGTLSSGDTPDRATVRMLVRPAAELGDAVNDLVAALTRDVTSAQTPQPAAAR